MLAFLVGSDYWPDSTASKIYVDKLNELNWDVPIIASAGMLGWPKNLGPSGMKMGMPSNFPLSSLFILLIGLVKQ
jgi:exo-1,4-beta-D-glucosaminidase